MTLADIHADPDLLADYLGFSPFGEPAQDWKHYWRRMPPAPRPENRDEFRERVQRGYRDYTNSTNPNKGQSWGAFIRECLSKEFKMRKGSVEACRAELLAKRPDIFTPHAETVAA